MKDSERKVLEYLSKRKFTVLFSGGKDSLASLLWVLENIPHSRWNIVYIEITGNTHELCTEYVKNICERLDILNKLEIRRREDLDFFDCLKKWGMPLIGKYRWCMYQFKLKLVKDIPFQVTGVKRSDSIVRGKRKVIELFRNTKVMSINPIFDWSNRDVLSYIKEHRVDINPCYKLFRHSGNCVFCPYHRDDQIILTLQDPVWGSKIRKALQELKARGRITKEKKEKWLKWIEQTSILQFMQVGIQIPYSI